MNKKRERQIIKIQIQIQIEYNSFTLDKFYVKKMNGNKTSRTNSSKPVNINISFTINPKNILNQQSFGIDNSIKNKRLPINAQPQDLEKQINTFKTKTPDLANTERIDLNKDALSKQQHKKERKNRKRNSVDETFLIDVNRRYQGEKSISLSKQGDSVQAKKSSTKSRKQGDSSTKRKHNKTVSKSSALQNIGVKQSAFPTTNLFEGKSKNIKNFISNIITNQLSKKSLPLQAPAQQFKTARKKKASRKKQSKEGHSEYLMRRSENLKQRSKQEQQSAENAHRRMIIEKLTSLRSMNNSIFKTQEDEQIKQKQRRTIVINTDQSIDCIDQIHEIQKTGIQLFGGQRQSFNQKDKTKVNQTKSLIGQYIALLNQEVNRQSQFEEYEQIPIDEQFEHFRRSTKKNSEILDKKQVSEQFIEQKRMQQKSPIKPFCSSEMTKQQKMINQIERVKLNELKKHQVEKWGELLTFIKQSLNEGKTNHDQILNNIYTFLQQTKMDLQKQISKDSSGTKDKKIEKNIFEEFTNKLSTNQVKKRDSREVNEENNEKVDEFNEISSMSFKDEDYEQQNEQLKLMNLEMIENALKARHQNLMQKKNRQIQNLEDQKNMGKLSEQQYNAQKDRIEKWTKKETAQIMQARKNIWKGYHQAKGIIEKSLKSKYFQEESAKKKSMMKCLSQTYLLKNYNYKKIAKQQSEQSQPQDKKPLKRGQQEFEKKNVVQRQKQPQLDSISPSHSHDDDVSLSDNENDIEEYSDHFDEDEDDINQVIKKKQNLKGQTLKNDENDISVLRQKLIDLKQKHLYEDLPTNKQQVIINNNSDVSYEEVDNELQQSISDNQMKLINQQLSRQGKLPSPDIINDQRLKHILPQDKEDIFEFIFLDLSIELYQEPCHQNRIMDSINKYVSYVKRQATKKKGVKTNLNVVKQYLKRFIGFILRAHKDVLKTLDEPVGPTALEMLRYMHQNDDEPAEGEQAPSPLVIPSSVFDAFEKSLIPSIQFEVYYQHDQQRQSKRVQFLKNILHIHNKALFDAMNQYLDILRPYGIWGKPFPWKKSSSFERLSTHQQKQQKIKKASDKVVEYCSYVCGLLVDKEQSLVGNARLTQQYVQQIKQDRLSRMLATQLMENQERWLFYDDQQTEVLVQISNAVYLIMLRQVSQQLRGIIKNS